MQTNGLLYFLLLIKYEINGNLFKVTNTTN